MNETNKSVVRQSWEFYEKRELAASRSLFAETFVAHVAGYPRDIELDEYALQGEEWLSAFPNFNLQIEDQVAEGDRVVTRAILRGTHQAVLLGIPATGKEVAVPGILIDRLEDGKIIERWANWDLIGMMQQLGLMPSLEVTQTIPGRAALWFAVKRRYAAAVMLAGSMLGLATVWRRSR